MAQGTAVVTVTGTDPEGLSAEQTFQVTVPNRGPVAVGSIPDLELTVGAEASVDVSAYFSDPDGDALSYEATSADGSVTTVSVSGSTVTATGMAQGTAVVTVTGTDPEGLSAEQTFQVTVPNRGPVAVGSIPDLELTVGAEASVDVSAYFSDPDGDALSYGATSADGSVTTVSVSGSTVTATGMAQGTAVVTVTGTDPEGLSAEQTFQVTVPNRGPEAVGSIPDLELTVGAEASVDVSAYFSDPDGDALSYGATSADGSVTTVSVSGSTVTATGMAQGTAVITVTGTDPEGLSAEQTFQVTVPNRGPEAVGSIPDLELAVGAEKSVDVSAYFSDPDGDALSYGATSADGSVTTVSVSGSTVTATGVAQGTAVITVTGTDPEGLSAEQTFQVTVPNRGPEAVGSIPDLELAVGAEASVDVSAYFSDPDGDALSYEATSADGDVTTVSVSGSTVTATGMAQGTAVVTVTGTDPEGLSAEQTFQVTVPNRGPVAVGSIPDLELAVGAEKSVDVSAYFSDPDGDALSYEATSADADVTTVSVSGSTVTATGMAQGTAEVTVTGMDLEGLSAEQAFEVTVLRNNRAPEAVGSIPDLELAVGAEKSVDVSAYFSDPDGDALSYEATSADADVTTVSVSGSTVTVTGMAQGTAEVTVTGMDLEGLSAEQAFEVTVLRTNNRAPEAVGSIPDLELAVGAEKSVDVSAYFSDPDGDALSYEATSADADVTTVSVTGSTVTVTGVGEGTAEVTVTGMDLEGLFAEQAFEVTVLRTNNRAPDAVGSIPDQQTTVDDEVKFDASLYFSDPDGDVLTYTARTNDTTIITASVSGKRVTVTGVGVGTANVTVTATDPEGLFAQQRGTVKISPFARDREALVALYEETGGDFWWTIDTNWLSDRPLGTWYGVEANDSLRVVELVLSDNVLWGPIPRDIVYLQKLERLDLSGNQVNGALPASLGDLRNLVELNLSENTFLGSRTSIPAALSKLRKLELLNLSGTFFNEEIPYELSRLESLTRLELAETPWLDGSIPPEFSELSNLKHLDVSRSGLDGALPQALVKLSLSVFYWNGTSLCSPDNEEFQDWLDSIDDHRGGRKCG